jgi:hypothetical protein
MNDHELLSIQKQVKQAKPERRYKLPQELKERIARYLCESGRKPTVVGKQIGLSDPTMLRIANMVRKSGFRKLDIVPDKSEPPHRHLAIELPSGAKVFGLSLADVRQILSGELSS